jgi:hypothetical protein
VKDPPPCFITRPGRLALARAAEYRSTARDTSDQGCVISALESVLDRISAPAEGGAPGGESPGSDPRKDCADRLIRAMSKAGGARNA